MEDRLAQILGRYEAIAELMADADIWSDPERSAALSKEQASLTPIVRAHDSVAHLEQELQGARELLQSDEGDLRELARAEVERLEGELETAREALRRLLVPEDPRDAKDVICEIRGGAGGDEAALFAADLFRMYGRFAERSGWTVELLESSETDIGGFKEVVFAIKGRGCFSRLKFESGVHRVQRVPNTETQGRIHTSTATVAVLPEVEEVEVDIAPEDLRIDTYRASGAGGQHINKTESAVRITHVPTGLVVACQDERSQHKNRDKAMRVLRARLYDMMTQQAEKEVADSRRQQVGTGDRSERIRTYNFPQGRVTDHRIGFTTHRLPAILDGDLDELVDALRAADEARRLEGRS